MAEVRLIFGEIVYDPAGCGLDHCVDIVDETDDKVCLTTARRSGHDQREGIFEGQHRRCHRSRRRSMVVETASAMGV